MNGGQLGADTADCEKLASIERFSLRNQEQRVDSSSTWYSITSINEVVLFSSKYLGDNIELKNCTAYGVQI